MRSHLALATRFALSGTLLALQAPAQPSATPATSASAGDTTEAARARFKTGTRLYRSQNFEGALAEFEAAYELKPGPGSLQNVALCQKALARYGEAVDSLTRLLTLYDAELSDAERSAAKRARDELEALVGEVRLVVVPPSAEVTVDGRVLAGVDRSGRLRLNAGEHTASATAPGYAPLATSFRVTRGQRDATLNLTLRPTSGFIDIRSADPGASIALDGKPVALGSFSAPVTPDAEHVVQIYRVGAVPFEARVTVKLGETAFVNGQPLPPAETSTPGATPSPKAPVAAPAPSPKPALGWYAVGSASLFATGATPFRFDLASAKSSAGGLGVHVGRRFWPAVALEGLLEYQVLKVRHACDERAGQLAAETVLCSDRDAVFVNYLIRSLRFGPSLQLMTTDPRLRAVGGIGTGAVWHELRLGLNRSAGVDPYLLLELGLAANTKHALFTLVLQTLVDGTRQMISGRYLGPENEIHEDAFDRSGRALTYVGLNLRVGYSEWSP